METYKGTLGFELEVNIVDNEGKVVNYIHGNIASAEVLHVLEGRQFYKRLVSSAGGKLVKPELDASQLELINPTPRESLRNLQDELAEAYYMVDKVVNSFGFKLSNKVVPPQDFEPVHSNALEKYQFIHDSLMSQGVDKRKSTNITGTHINFLAGPVFQYHIAMTKFVREKILTKNRRALGGSPERIQHYINVVDALENLGFVKHGYIPHDIQSIADIKNKQLDKDLNAIFSYELERLKTPPTTGLKLFLSELRTIDGPTSYDDVYHKTQGAYDIVIEATSVADEVTYLPEETSLVK